MSPTVRRRAPPIWTLLACFCLGAIADWWVREKSLSAVVTPVVAPVLSRRQAEAGPVATTGDPAMSAARPSGGDAMAELQRRDLRMPIDGADVARMRGSFEEHRSGSGGHGHEAADILAPRNTPIHAVEDGTIAKLFFSKAGGNTIYQFDPSRRFCYYYAHLERYAEAVREGQRVTRGDVIGYVGTSGNAPPGTPHLHFGVYELTADQRWWQGRAIDPYLVFRH